MIGVRVSVEVGFGFIYSLFLVPHCLGSRTTPNPPHPPHTPNLKPEYQCWRFGGVHTGVDGYIGEIAIRMTPHFHHGFEGLSF